MTAPARAALPTTTPARAAEVALVGLPFAWLGAVVAISFVEAPLKFQAPGITLPLGLGIGRLVFLALSALEVVMATTLAALVWRRRRQVSRTVRALLASVAGVLLVQLAVLRPVLDERTLQVIAGTPPPAAPWHVLYIGLEVVKAGLLVALGTAAVAAVVAAARDGASR